MHTPLQEASKDIFATFSRLQLVAILGWQDIRQRYRRSAIGPFWLSISMAVMIGTMGLVFGQIFKAPMSEYLPFITVSIILWGFISAVITEGCTSFIAAEGIIKQLPIPLFVHVLRVVWRNIIILCHNLVILPLIYIFFSKTVTATAFISLVGFLVVVINLAWGALLLAVLSSRYRDLPQMISSTLQIAFYLTPIMWMPSLLPTNVGLNLLSFNPFFHLIEIVRAPILGNLPTLENWSVALVLAIGGWLITIWIYGRFKRRIVYWI